MRNLSIRLIAAILTFLIGITVTAVWLVSRTPKQEFRVSIPHEKWVHIYFEMPGLASRSINETAGEAGLANLSAAPLPGDDLEVRAWSGFGIDGKVYGVIVRRSAGRWSVIHLYEPGGGRRVQVYEDSQAVPKTGWDKAWGELVSAGGFARKVGDERKMLEACSPLDSISSTDFAFSGKATTMRIIIIGGTGFIGAPVTKRLVNAGHDVTVFHRGQTESGLLPAVKRIRGERSDLTTFRGEFERFRPQVVIDMIPYTETDARTVIDTCRGAAQRMVAISSMDVYRAYGGFTRLESGPPHTGALTEESPLRERLYPYRAQARGPGDMAYCYEKILVERQVLNDPELPGTVLRLPKVYGPRDRQHHLFEYLKRMDDGRPAILLEEEQARWRWTRGYVENVAAAIAQAAVDGRDGSHVYNVGEEPAPTEEEWVRRVGRAAGWRGQVKVMPRRLMPESLLLPFDWRYHLAADTSRMRTALGYSEPVATGDAPERSVAWERSHPPATGAERHYDYDAEDAALRQAEEQGVG